MKTQPYRTNFARNALYVLPLALAGFASLALTNGCSSTESGDGGTGGTTPAGTGGSVTSGGNSAAGGSTSSATSAPKPAGGAGGSTATAGGATSTPVKPLPVGLFGVTLHGPQGTDPGYTSMVGGVRDKADPQARVWTVTQESGECQLLKPSTPFCDPSCNVGETCVEGGTCAAAAVAHSVGTVTVTGIKTAAGTSSFTTEPNANKGYVFAEALAYPPFAPGDAVKVATAGGDYAAFSLEAKGFATIETSLTEVTLESGKASTVTWTAGTAGTTINVLVDISHHGGIKGKIVCNAADDGSLEIPAALVTALINLGVAGFPTVNISRQSIGSATLTHGRVDLLISSPIELPVVIPGVTSCNKTEDCPTGKTCSTIYLCQ